MTTTVFACPAHAPAGISPTPNDDGRPACSICGRSGYDVKPFEISESVVERGYWRLPDGGIAEIPKPPAAEPEFPELHSRQTSPDRVEVPSAWQEGVTVTRYVGVCSTCGYRTRPKGTSAVANRAAGLHVSAANKREGAAWVDAYVAAHAR